MSQVSEICLSNSCGSFAEVLRRLWFPMVKWPTSIAEICGDDESAQKLCRRISKSWLVKFRRLTGCRKRVSGTPSLPTKNLSTKICWLKISGISPMGLGIPSLNIKIMFESNSLKSRISAGRLGVRERVFKYYMCVYIYIYIYRERERHTYMCMYVYIYIYTYIHMICRLPPAAPVKWQRWSPARWALLVTPPPVILK